MVPKQCPRLRPIIWYLFCCARCLGSQDIVQNHTHVHTYIHDPAPSFIGHRLFDSGFAPAALSLRLNKYVLCFVSVYKKKLKASPIGKPERVASALPSISIPLYKFAESSQLHCTFPTHPVRIGPQQSPTRNTRRPRRRPQPPGSEKQGRCSAV